MFRLVGLWIRLDLLKTYITHPTSNKAPTIIICLTPPTKLYIISCPKDHPALIAYFTVDVWQRFITWRFRCKPIWHVIPVFAKPLLHQEEVGRTHILSILIQLKKDGVKGSLFKSHCIPWHCSVDKIPAANILDNPFQLHLVFPLVIDYKIIQSVFTHVPINQNCIIREGMMKFSLQMCKSSKVMDDGLSRCGVHWDRLEG